MPRQKKAGRYSEVEARAPRNGRRRAGSTEVAYYLSNAPEETPLLKLAQVASTRFRVEQRIEEAKGETGLDEVEVRH
jgi:SRSO17 transposase